MGVFCPSRGVPSVLSRTGDSRVVVPRSPCERNDGIQRQGHSCGQGTQRRSPSATPLLWLGSRDAPQEDRPRRAACGFAVLTDRCVALLRVLQTEGLRSPAGARRYGHRAADRVVPLPSNRAGALSGHSWDALGDALGDGDGPSLVSAARLRFLLSAGRSLESAGGLSSGYRRACRALACALCWLDIRTSAGTGEAPSPRDSLCRGARALSPRSDPRGGSGPGAASPRSACRCGDAGPRPPPTRRTLLARRSGTSGSSPGRQHATPGRRGGAGGASGLSR